MNKQELIEKYKKIINDNSLGLFGCYNRADKLLMQKIYKSVLDDLKQLDEPQKPAVPQFVADWYEENKDDFEGNLFRCINTISSMYEDEELNDFENWVIEAHTEPFQTLVNMHQFGYEVEKEKRYIVKFKNVQSGSRYFKYDGVIGKWYFGINQDSNTTRLCHTKEELEEAGFGDVFNSPLFEVEEVE